MKYAISLAQEASRRDEIPVGAIVVYEDRIIGEGFNRSICDHDPSAHAEMIAIRKAASAMQNYRLPNTTLYVTLEPCPMCAGLLVHSRVKRLVFGAFDAKTGAAGSVMQLACDQRLNHQIEVVGGVLKEQCGDILSSFFRRRRAQKKAEKKEVSR